MDERYRSRSDFVGGPSSKVAQSDDFVRRGDDGDEIQMAWKQQLAPKSNGDAT